MKKLLFLLILLLFSCSPQLPPPSTTIKHRARYESQSNKDLQKWIEEEWPRDTLGADTFWIIIPRENNPPIIKKIK